MLIKKLTPLVLIACLTTTIAACGGGGNNSPQTASSSQGNLSSSSQSFSSTPEQAISRINTPTIVSGYLDLLLFTKDTAAAMINNHNANRLADGTYKDKCNGGKGSFEITVSNNGNRLAQKYNDCLMSVTENGVTETMLISGEELINNVINNNAYPRLNVSWKNYSIKIDNDPPLILTGDFSYVGYIYLSPSSNYKNVMSRVTINTKISFGQKFINIENANFTLLFSSIFDSYDGAGGFSSYTSHNLHEFSYRFTAASGALTVDAIKSNFELDPENNRVSFSNSFVEKSYLETTTRGFYMRWDENNDNIMDANIFLTENEYSDLSEHIMENTDIYFTRYNKAYITLPPNYIREGNFNWVHLTKGESVEINVQELFTSKSGALFNYEINGQSISTDWEQPNAGIFKLIFPYSKGNEIHELYITAVDTNNNRSPAVKVSVIMNNRLADTDNDGILDIDDPDIDNDGIANYDDRFPEDPTEWADTDNDGIGDNSDPDRDNDGILNEEDHFPNDANCSKENSGDSHGCYFTNTRYAFNDGKSIVYFLQTIRTEDSHDRSRFLRFDTIAKKFLTPSPILDISGDYTYSEIYNPIYNRALILDYMNKKIFLVDLADYSLKEIRDVVNNEAVPRLSDNGYFAVSVSNSETHNSWTEVYDKDGQLISSNKLASIANPTRHLADNLQRRESVPFCKYAIFINDEGILTEAGDYSQIHSDNCLGVSSTSLNHLYTFPYRSYAGPRAVYDQDGNTVATVNDSQMQWMGEKLVYLDVDAYLLSHGLYWSSQTGHILLSRFKVNWRHATVSSVQSIQVVIFDVSRHIKLHVFTRWLGNLEYPVVLEATKEALNNGVIPTSSNIAH